MDEPQRSGERSVPRVVVFVCGERLRGDDGVALRAVELLAPEVAAMATIVPLGQLSIEALLDVSESTLVVLADAAFGVEPGRIVTVPLAALAASGGVAGVPFPASTHSLAPDQVVALAAELRGSMPRGSFVGVGAADFGLGKGLSPAVEAALPDYVAALEDAIRFARRRVP
jgi:hydrogenase maturation protease